MQENVLICGQNSQQLLNLSYKLNNNNKFIYGITVGTHGSYSLDNLEDEPKVKVISNTKNISSENIDKITGATKQKLIDGKQEAFDSKSLATIYKEVNVPYSLEELKIGEKTANLRDIYEDLEFYSFLIN